MVVREEGPDEGLFDKDPAPPQPEIENSAASPSAPGHPIEAGVFNTSNRAEYISLVRNQGLEVYDDVEPFPNNLSLVSTTAADTLIERQTWGWDGIDRRTLVAQNHNDPSFKNGWIHQSLYYIVIFLQCIPHTSQMIENRSSPINIQGYEGGRFCSIDI